MPFLMLANSSPWLFWLLAAVWSLGQGVPGYVCGDYICETNRPAAGTGVRRTYALHHAALYFATSLSGFAAWALLAGISTQIDEAAKLQPSVLTVLAVVASFVVLAISGALARILYTGIKPW